MAKKDLMLIVDDSKLARLMIKGFASQSELDLDFLEAANGDEALELIDNGNIVHISIDFNMPGMDGLELAEKIKAARPAANICLLTANIQDAIQERTKALDIRFVPKPINEEKIINFLKAS